jgi:hypothetical protein
MVGVVLMVVMTLATVTLQAGPPEIQAPVGSAFTYQGRLLDGGGPVTDGCDFRFGLWDAASGGSQLGTTQSLAAVPVADGYFTVHLNGSGQFGSDAFQGEARYLSVSVRCPTGSGTYASLDRQALAATPYAHYALGAPWAGLTGVPAGFADGVDNNTTYSAGQGLMLDHGEFYIPTVFLLPLGCSDGGIAEYDSKTGVWVCGVDDTGAGGSFWSLGGNLGTDPATHYVGTSDAVSLTLRVDGAPALRLAPSPGAPNLIGGSEYNVVTAGAKGAVIGGGGGIPGERNLVSDDWGTVSGGHDNQAGDDDGDPTDATNATVGGGEFNVASGYHTTVAGGSVNTASGWYATVGGGGSNESTFSASTIAGGWQNQATADYTTVAGGYGNQATATGAAIGGGSSNVASGEYAMIPGGGANVASGDYSFAAGRFAQANNDGCFVWSDSTLISVGCPAADRWVAQASGGVYFYTASDLSTGAYLSANSGTWSSVSDRAVKEHLAPVDAEAVLRAVAALPITTWNYRGEAAGVQHMGPMAQDFYAAFRLGDSERHITTIDADGVALAAIQGLAAENAALQAQVEALVEQNAAFEARLSALEAGAGGAAPARFPGAGSLWWAGGLVLVVAGVWSFGRRRPAGGGR